MGLKGYFDNLLDRGLGVGKTPNLPSRLVECRHCKKVMHVADGEKHCDHEKKLADETWLNYLKTFLP